MALSDEMFATLMGRVKDSAESGPERGQRLTLYAIADRLDAVRGEVARLADVFEEAGK